MKKRGLFITFEGIEGSGKSTQAALLARRFRREHAREVILTREPGGTPLGEKIRTILKAADRRVGVSAESELLLFQASRAELIRRVIRPALERGAIVISDRFMDSTTVYQGRGRGLDARALAAVNALAVGETTPDLTILLDVGVAEGFRRLARRGGAKDRIERESAAFHRRIRRAYLELARRNPRRFRVVSSSADVRQVAGKIWEIAGNAV